MLDKLQELWDHLRRWRTWLWNVACIVGLGLGQLLAYLDGIDWGMILPQPWGTVAGIVIMCAVNIAMRPRAAVLPHEASGEPRPRRRRRVR